MSEANPTETDEPEGLAAPWRASVLTLYPDMFPGPLGTSLAGRALENEIWSLEAVHIRDFAEGKHRNVDDTPAGGGAGMVLRPDVVSRAIDHVTTEGDTRPRILLSPRGKPLTQKRCTSSKRLAVSYCFAVGLKGWISG